MADHRFIILAGAHWADVRGAARDVARVLRGAFRAMETANPERPAGVFGNALWEIGEVLSEVVLQEPERAAFPWPRPWGQARRGLSVSPIVDIVPACRRVSTKPDQAHHVGGGVESRLRLAW